MSKISFSKAELSKLHEILSSEKLIPCDKIEIYTDVYNSGVTNVYSKISFVKGKKQVDVGFVTLTYPNNSKLQAQLHDYFGGK